MRQGYLGHLSDMPHQVVYAMREDSGEHREQGEENSRPVGDVDEKEVVDMNTALGGEDKFKEEYQGNHTE